MLAWKIAWRNLWRHKGKSLVVGGILLLGALLMTVGNSLIEGAQQGLKENMVERFTGHLVLVSDQEKRDNVLFENNALHVLADYPHIKEVLQEQDELIEDFLPMTRGVAMLLNEDGDSWEIFVFGVNFDDYQKMFHENVMAVEGELLQNGDRGILMSTISRESIYKFRKFWLLPEGGEIVPENLTEKARERFEKNGTLDTQDQLVLMGFSRDSFGTDIRLPIKGIFKFKSLDKVWEGVNLMDIESYRESFGYISAADNAIELSNEQETLLESDDIDDIFGDAALVEETTTTTQEYDLEALQAETTRQEVHVDPDDGAYNLVTIKLRPGMSEEEGKARLEAILKEADAGVKVLTWKQACLEVAQFANMTQGALSVFVMFIFFVAIIVIMNTLSMAAIERTGEIGMMRAVGARKGFISKMFFAETALLSCVFGGFGILGGVLVSWILAALNISVTGNDLLNLMFASDTLHPIVTSSGVISGSIQLAFVTLLAMAYPIRVARKITPLEAISRD